MKIEDIERLAFDVSWKIENVDIRCAGPEPVLIYFDTDQIWDDNNKHCASLPPTKKQFETLQHIARLPKNFLRKYRALIQNECRETMEATDYGEPIEVDLKKIEHHYRVSYIVIPLPGRSRSHNFVLMANCVWEKEHGLGIQCRGDKVINVGTQHDFL